MSLNLNSNVKIECDVKSAAVINAIDILKRDLQTRFLKSENPVWRLMIRIDEDTSYNNSSNSYIVYTEPIGLKVIGQDELGIIYGILAISREYLGINDFWFWNDKKIEKIDKVTISLDSFLHSPQYAVEHRGWFINDEVLLHTWDLEGDKTLPWIMAFEALLRCGGNTVIPGTYKNADIYTKYALDMGLSVAQHHAQPLGAKMFSQAFPDEEASFSKNPNLYRKLWIDAIDEHKNDNIIWSLGFRGQGDCPFWENDPVYDTDEARGKLMSDIITEQYNLLKERVKNPVCCVNMYGEAMDLYVQGLLKVPDEVIKLWSDNGYGKMVSRRQDEHNPRVVSMPKKENGKSGIYYHISFYDLQASNHITMLSVSPNLISEELNQVLDNGGDCLWIINCSNVKPHVFYLSFISKIWNCCFKGVNEFIDDYVNTYFGASIEGVKALFRDYSNAAIFYGENEDDKAGEEYYNHVVRMLVSHGMKNSDAAAPNLKWACKAATFKGQISYFIKQYEKAVVAYGGLLEKANTELVNVSENSRNLYMDSIMLQIKIYYHCSNGALLACKALDYLIKEEYLEAFYNAGLAGEEYEKANSAMRDREHGKWIGFYENECLTNVKQTAYVLKGFMFYIRNLGDGPHFYGWHRRFLYSKEDRDVTLVMNMENHLDNDELFMRMKKEFDN